MTGKGEGGQGVEHLQRMIAFNQEIALVQGALGHQEGVTEVTGPAKYRFKWDQKVNTEGVKWGDWLWGWREQTA